MSKRKNSSHKRKQIRIQRKIQSIENKLGIESKKLESLKLKLQKDRLNNIKAFGVRNIKIVGAVSRFVAPYILAGSLTIGIAYAAGIGLPFVVDDKAYPKGYFLEYETDEKLNYEEAYNSEKSYVNFVSITTPWTVIKEGSYERYIREYVVDDSNIESLFDALLNDDTDFILNNIEVKKETREERTYIETGENDYDVSAALQRENKEITMELPEGSFDNFLATALDLIIIAVLSYGWTHFSNFKVGDRIKVICGEYKRTVVLTTELVNQIRENKKTVLALRKELTQYGRK